MLTLGLPKVLKLSPVRQHSFKCVFFSCSFPLYYQVMKRNDCAAEEKREFLLPVSLLHTSSRAVRQSPLRLCVSYITLSSTAVSEGATNQSY